MKNWEIFAKKYNINYDKNGINSSNYWSNGGSYGNCWNDSMGTTDADDPEEPTNLDEIIMEVCPNISYLQYKEIKKRCLTSRTWTEGDYYGGSNSYSQWDVNIENLYKILIELNIITE
jgi:hypothetical protein